MVESAQGIEVPISSCSVPLHNISTYHPLKGYLELKNILCKCVAVYTRKTSQFIKTKVECHQNIHLKQLDKSKLASTGSARSIASNSRTSQSFPVKCWCMVYITEKANETQLCPNNTSREHDLVGHENFSFTPWWNSGNLPADGQCWTRLLSLGPTTSWPSK